MDEAPGTRLGSIWHSMEIDDKLEIVDSISEVESKLLSMSFTKYDPASTCHEVGS